ncbi:hypothetical protein MXAN_5289 [Myxococcus xanthus DK 1622]|uniref:Uncharacterized protein n=1 Tax=Myxococcus xanthus (strain DK1622) TaxID=246197 RepID=Q1D1N2_MYXXD|nr:hypothetical protein MXAN_5289 [Myxococcus xanthus DK 1622]
MDVGLPGEPAGSWMLIHRHDAWSRTYSGSAGHDVYT